MGKIKKTKRKGKAVGTHVKRYRATMLAISFVVCMLLVLLCIEGVSLQQRIVANDEKKDALTSEIEKETARTSELDALDEYMQSDAYAEETARDKMGLLKDNEILFKAQK